jgi:radical SAM protein with 4Fe4S-binding SPASM domain
MHLSNTSQYAIRILSYLANHKTTKLYSAKEYGEFLLDFYKEWEKDNYGICVEPFNGWTVKNKTGSEEQLTCYFSGTCSGDMFLVLPNGDTYECCEFSRIHDAPVGNLVKDEFAALHSNRVEKIIDYTNMMKDNACDGCEWWDYCHGYCPIKTHGEKREDLHYFCESYKTFFSSVFKEPHGDKKPLDVSKIKQLIKEKENVI